MLLNRNLSNLIYVNTSTSQNNLHLKPMNTRKLTKFIQHLLTLITLLSIYINNATAQSLNAGQVQFFNNADSDFNQYIKNPSTADKKWINSHYKRMLSYPPSFDKKTAWYNGALAYIDSYAIYSNDTLAKSHPEWIMRDARGNKLYIPWSCSGGHCSQFAGDFSNPAFRRYMVQKIKTTVAKGYRGVWLDDINLTWRVGNTNDVNKFIVPIDSTTKKPMTLANWRLHFTKYLEEIRKALPRKEISHNAIWYADRMNKINPVISRQIKAANYINLERGGNDGGLVQGRGQWGYETFLKYIDYVHKLGTNVILMDTGSSQTEREYGLATWLLISQGNDLFNNNQSNGTTPNNWWHAYSLNLGAALNNHYVWRKFIRRDFACGSVFLNQPGMPTLSSVIGNGFKNLNGHPTSSISLRAKTATILTTTCKKPKAS